MMQDNTQEALAMQEDYEAGMTTGQIAAKYFYSVETIKARLKSVGTKLSTHRRIIKPKMSEAQIKDAYTLYKTGLSVARVGDRFDISGTHMAKLFHQRGLILRKGHSKPAEVEA